MTPCSGCPTSPRVSQKVCGPRVAVYSPAWQHQREARGDWYKPCDPTHTNQRSATEEKRNAPASRRTSPPLSSTAFSAARILAMRGLSVTGEPSWTVPGVS